MVTENIGLSGVFRSDGAPGERAGVFAEDAGPRDGQSGHRRPDGLRA